MSRALFLATLLVALPAAAQSQRVETLGWMAGSWEQSGRERVMETWTAPSNGMMVGASLTTSPGRRTFEFMRIVDTPESMSYLASPGGRPAVEFKLRETGDKKVVFENLGHDYPQRITYWKDGELLAARIEGNVRGQARSEEWKYQPVRAAASGGSGG
jgi:hypothetical protein